MTPHVHPVQIYYEDTDHSGVVYHANYLRYMERAREHLLGVPELVRLWKEEGVGFVVYQASLKFREGAVFGDSLEIRTVVRRLSAWRLAFQQDVWRPGGVRPLVEGEVQLCCVDGRQQLIALPEAVLKALEARFPPGSAEPP